MDYHVEEIQESAFVITRWMGEQLIERGASEQFVDFILLAIQLGMVLLFTYLFQLIARRFIIFVLKKLGKRKRLKISNHLVENKFPTYLALFVPLTWLINTVPIVFEKFPVAESLALKLLNLSIVIVIAQLLISISKSIKRYLLSLPKYKDKPIESYFQVIRIILVIFTVGAIISIITATTMRTFFTSMGAASAIMMLVFKDSILGLVASIQVTTNDMVRRGDWITMPKFNADGDVQEISLTTVKVINFDKTIITIPTYALISESFQNWRGMQDTGGRRIKRSIKLKQSSIRFIDNKELERYRKIQFLQSYIPERKAIIDAHNKRIDADKSIEVNGRHLTNIGLFRQYIVQYLRSLEEIKQDMTIMVRQLEPGEEGLPVELYCFTATTNWSEYENIMSDIFDHLIASAPYFDLEIFEASSSNDKVLVKQI